MVIFKQLWQLKTGQELNSATTMASQPTASHSLSFIITIIIMTLVEACLWAGCRKVWLNSAPMPYWPLQDDQTPILHYFWHPMQVHWAHCLGILLTQNLFNCFTQTTYPPLNTSGPQSFLMNILINKLTIYLIGPIKGAPFLSTNQQVAVMRLFWPICRGSTYSQMQVCVLISTVNKTWSIHTSYLIKTSIFRRNVTHHIKTNQLSSKTWDSEMCLK